ncbi:flagellar motor protein MotB [Thiobacillus denitrificans]|uniref:Flagellar motor protein MotB n=2 Tax=Thiobacillus denitrificans TaxID=36861 RepID=A0A119CWS2_THIDE|nr:flagellar motor protein MotB [Thiobacillus denitrificans]
MKKNRYFPLSLIAAAMLAGCSTLPPQNTALDEARSVYSSARTNPQVVNLAPLELQKAGETLSKADAALSKGDSDVTVNQLAYLTKQQVAVAQETAKRKAAEAAVVSASAQRDQVRLAARTAEAEAARRQAAMSQTEVDEARRQAAIAQQTAEQQAAALAAASSQAQRDEAQIAARQAELEAARQQALSAQQTAEQKAAALEAARAQAERDQALIAQQEQQLRELDAKQTDRGMVITLGDVLFSINKAQLSPGGVRNVQKLADFLNQYPQRKVLIEGHTDSTGSLSINQPLSERRADAVRTALVDRGISGDRIETRGYAEAYPVASNNTAAGRQLNRRVEIILSDDSGNIVPR